MRGSFADSFINERSKKFVKKKSGKTTITPKCHLCAVNTSSTFISGLKGRLEACERRCKEIESIVIELSRHNQQLSETNMELTNIVESLNERIHAFDMDSIGRWKKLIHFAVPVPVDLKYERQSPTEILLKWDHRSVIQPTSHGFTVNEDFIGKSRGFGNQTLIGDLLPDKEATIKVHCYVDDIEGERSLPIYIPPYAGNSDTREDSRK